MERENSLLLEMLCFEQGHGRRTEHVLKVRGLALLLADAAGMPREQQEILGAAAILHDIGIRLCKEKYGDASQENQQKEAPAAAKAMLDATGYYPGQQERIQYLIRTHHCYDRVEGLDHQVLVEADLLVNGFESGWTKEEAARWKPVLQTAAGKRLFETFFEKA